ncbi:MAG: DUF4870 domain-containing protein [bacterium]|nr:DUF4870 domain-containing protein [bacterium]
MNQIEKDARTWAMLCHLAGFMFYLLPGVGQIVGPLIIWLIKKDEYGFVDEQGKEAINFQISFTIYGLISAFLLIAFIGILLIPMLLVAQIVLMVIAAIKANDGEHYRYPLTIRFIS